MILSLAGKTALVTGGSKGIGMAAAMSLSEARARVAICSRNAEEVKKTAADIETKTGHRVVGIVADVSNQADVDRLVQEIIDLLGGIDILVNNASAFGGIDDEAGWTSSVAVDLMATVRAIRAALPYLEKSSSGAILNISSISGLRATPRTPPYAAVKAAVVNYTLTEAAALARKGIRVNGIAPGSIEFPGGTWERARLNNPDLYGRILRSIPFGRLGRPEEIAQVALFLCSPLAGWVTGQNIAVDGGQML
jgi:3-oxoacyl-[acyl-carrier protein] reductase